MNRPIALSGTGVTSDSATTGTSKMYPCSCSHPRDVPSTLSSQVSQLCHGVGPPAQLTIVPFRLMKSRTTSGTPPSAMRTSSEVVHPPALASYAFDTSPLGLAVRGVSRFSWLQISRTLPLGSANAAMPSKAPGVGVPSDIGLPLRVSTV